MDGWMMAGWVDGWVKGRVGGRTDGWMDDGWMNNKASTHIHSKEKRNLNKPQVLCEKTFSPVFAGVHFLRLQRLDPTSLGCGCCHWQGGKSVREQSPL